LLVFFLGGCAGAEIVRRAGTTAVGKSMAARLLLLAQTLFLMLSFITSKMHEDIGSDEWRASTASYVSTFLMVLAFAQTNVFQRNFLTGLPIVALMTGNITALAENIMGIVFDAKLRNPRTAQEKTARLQQLHRIRNNLANVVLFTAGAIGGTMTVKYIPDVSFSIPAVLSLLCTCVMWGSV
jgi:uncharacterized membrane protein YoaK (UPF0700 family)